MRETILFYRSFYNAIRLLGDKARLKLYDSVMELYFECDENLSNLEQLCAKIETKLGQNRFIFAQFLLIKPQIIANLMKYKNGCKGAEYGALGAEYGKLGGRPKKPPKNPPKEKGVMNKEKGVMNKEEGVMNKVSFSSFKKEKKEKSLNFSFEKKEDFKKTFNSFCENSFNFPSENQAFKEDIHSKPSLLEENRGEVYPNAPDLEGFEEGRGQIDPPLEEEKQAVTSCNQLEIPANCSQLEGVTSCHGLDKGELCPNEGQSLRNPEQLPQSTPYRRVCNPNLMYDTDVNKVFEIYAKECRNLIPIGYENRDMAYRGKIKEFLDVISGDFAYFTDVCRKANELKVIMLKKIDLKMLINCHARIHSGFYEVENSNKEETMAEFLARKNRETENAK